MTAAGRRARWRVQLTISRLADRPDLAEAMCWAMPSSWPGVHAPDPIGGLYYGNVESRFAEFVLVGQDEAGEVVAVAHSIPFVLGDDELPAKRLGLRHPQRPVHSVQGGEPDTVSAVEIAVRLDHQGRGLSGADADGHARERRPARVRQRSSRPCAPTARRRRRGR